MFWTKDDLMPIAQRQYTVATSIPLGAVLGLAIGGTVFAAFLAITAIHLARIKDRRKRKKLKELDAETTKEKAVPLRTIRSPLRLSQRSSFNPFLPAEQASVAMSNEWLEDESMMDSPPMTKAQARRLSQKGRFQIPRIRDSWPLAASMPNVPLHLLQPNSSMVTLNQVGGGGYVVPPERPQWPGRTYSRKTKTKIVVSAEESNWQRFSTSEFDIAPKRLTHQRRSASVNQLSTILRSTSQRLKAAQRKSLSRTLTTFGGSMGPPPSDKLKTPRKAASESQIGLVEPEVDDAATIASSICNAFNSSPSPTRKDTRHSTQGSVRHRSSITPSVESVESLCERATPDLEIPAALTSPSKKVTKSPQRQAIRISSTDAKDLSAMIRGEGRASALEVGTKGSPEEKAAFTSPHRIFLASDPFYSAVKSGKRAIPQNKILGPRPLFMRQTTFGHEATAERPASFTSISSLPLQHISGNIQSFSGLVSPSNSVASEASANLFSWEPENTSTTRLQQNPSRTGSRRKGHKRSNVVRISLLPRPPCVSPLPEDPEEEDSSPLKFKIPMNAPMRASDPTKSPSPKPSSISHRHSTRPPSISFFNPSVSVPELAEGSLDAGDDSPILGFEIPPQIYSPTLTTSNYYYSDRRTSEDTFFNVKPVGLKTSSLDKKDIHRKNHTVAAFPNPEHKELFSFPPLTLNTTQTDRVSLPPPRPSRATSIHSSISPKLLAAPQSLLAPPVLTQPEPCPSHLNGPRSEPQQRLSNNSLGPRESLLHQSICMLRRMNSEVSRCSSASIEEEEGRSSVRSPPKLSPNTSNRSRKFERQSRGSKAYLSMGMSEQMKSRISKHQSGRRDKIAEKYVIEEYVGEGLVGWERKGLETMKEIKSESYRLKAKVDRIKQEESVQETFKFPIPNSPSEKSNHNEQTARKNSLTTELVTPTSPSTASPLKIVRWSDATPAPTIRVIRHESLLLQPTPQNLPAWGWRKSNLGKEEVEGVEDIKENLVNTSPTSPVKESSGIWKSNFGRPHSLGLYDADGFLKSSPEKAVA